jgi:hypothetical protein
MANPGLLAIGAVVLAGCTGGGDGDGLESSCAAVATRFCDCREDPEEMEDCVQTYTFQACALYGGAPSAGCAGGKSCIRSSVDFAACRTALEEVECWGGDQTFPTACKTAACATPTDGCPEEPR